MKHYSQSAYMVVHRTQMKVSTSVFGKGCQKQCLWVEGVQIGVLDKVICFNDGAQARKLVFSRMGIEPGNNNCSSALLLFDREHVIKSERDLLHISKAP